MSALSTKTEFAFDAPVRISQPMPAGRTAPRGLRRLAASMTGALRWVAEQPRRRAVIHELETLTDHELADIGLSRVTLHRVFDRDFALGGAA